MAVRRMDNVLIVVDDLKAAIAFFAELGLELEGEAPVEGRWVDRTVGLDGVRADIAMMRTPDGHGRVELSKFHSPAAISPEPKNPPVNTLGMGRIMFAVDHIDDVLSRLHSHGAELVGEVARYEDKYRLCYVRGPEGISSRWPSSSAEAFDLLLFSIHDGLPGAGDGARLPSAAGTRDPLLGKMLLSDLAIVPQHSSPLLLQWPRWSQTKEVQMPKRHMGSKHSTDAEAKPEQAAGPTPEVIAPEDEVHPHIDAETPHVDPTGVADFDRPYDQWSNDDLKIRAKQLGVVGVYGHGELIDKIREAELRLAEQEATTAETS